MSPYLANCNDLYTYDWHGNFQGVNSAVVDLTLCDDPLPTKKSIKKEPDASKSLDHVNGSITDTNSHMTPPATDAPPDTKKALPTTAPTNRRRGQPRKVKVCKEEIPAVQTGELDTDLDGPKVGTSGRQQESTGFSSSDFEVVRESEHLKERKGRKMKKATKTRKNGTVGTERESYSDTEARHRTRQMVPSDGEKREKEEKKINRKRTTSGVSVHDSDTEARQTVPSDGKKRETEEKKMNRKRTTFGGNVHDSDAETRHRTRKTAPSDGEKREGEEKKINRRRTTSGGRDSGVHSNDQARQPEKIGNNKWAKKRERTAPGGSVSYKFGQADAKRAGKKAHSDTSSAAGGKEKGREVSRMLLSSEGENSEGEGITKNQQRVGKKAHIKIRRLCISESETGSDQSESEATNERGQPISVAALLSPAKKKVRWSDEVDKSKRVHLGEPRDNKSTPNGPHSRKEHRPISKATAVGPSDKGDAFSILLSPVKMKKAMLWGGGAEAEERGEAHTRTSSAIADGCLLDGEPRDDKMTQSQLCKLRQ